MAAERNFYIRQGDTFTHTIVVWNGVDENGDKIPLDLTDAGVFSDIRVAGESPLSEPGAVLGSFIGSASGNIITLILSSTESATIPPGKHWYDIEVITNIRKTYLSGTVIVIPAVAVEDEEEGEEEE